MGLWRLFLTMLSVLLVTVSLSACGTTGTTVFVQQDIPNSIRHCANEPARLTGDFTQKDVAVYIEKLRAAWKECHNDLATVDRILTEQEQVLNAKAKNND